MDTASDVPTPTTDHVSPVPVAETPGDKILEPQQSGTVRLPPVPSRASFAVGQPRSILKTTSTSQPAPAQPETQPVTQATEEPPQTRQTPPAEASPEIGTVDADASRRPQPRKQPWHTKAALILATALAIAVAGSLFVVAFTDRFGLYKLHGLVHTSHVEELLPEWLELAVCFGPRLPAGALRGNVTAAAPPSVDGASSYWQLLGGGGYEWRRPPFELLARPAALVAGGLGHLQVTTSEKKQETMRYTDMPLMLHYSFCRNFSGFQWPPSRGDAEHWIDLAISVEEHDRLLDGVSASYVDVFAYKRGTFSEFFSVSPLLGYRTDLKRPLRLRLEVQLHRHLSHSDSPCTPDSEPTSCLYWCLTRALFRRAGCTMPWMDALVYNMSAMRTVQQSVPTQRDPAMFSARTALPWMSEFSGLRPCGSAEEFSALFRLVDGLLVHEAAPPDAEALRCRAACPPPCDRMVTRLRMAGGTLAEWRGVTLLRVEVPHSIQMLRRRLLFETPALLLELAGLLAALCGASLLRAHAWCLATVCQLLRCAGVLETTHGGGGAGGDEERAEGSGKRGAADAGEDGSAADAKHMDEEHGAIGDHAGEGRRNMR